MKILHDFYLDEITNLENSICWRLQKREQCFWSLMSLVVIYLYII